MNRKQRRALNKATKKNSGTEISRKMLQFDKLPEQCLTCEKSFDKKDKKMVKTWNVVIKGEDTVRLYCPDCWAMANKIILDWRKEIENASE
tara:strand:+ start:869 stop:1141 length:273 start_codon:yes stop_codon:yes gene_type:complete